LLTFRREVALIDAGALDYEYITAFMTNGKLIVVLTARG
jgi:hypothetical protein